MSPSLKKILAPVIASVSLASAIFAVPVVSERSVSADSGQKIALPSQKKGLPLGFPFLREQRTTQSIAPGMTHTKITRGLPFERDFFTVDVDFTETHDQAKELAKKLKSEGYNPTVHRIANRAPDDKVKGPLGYLVRIGKFETEEEAKKLQQQLTASGYKGHRTVFTGEDGQPTTGPWVINVLEVDPRTFNGTMLPVLANDRIQDREKLSSMSTRYKALAAINGGYFVMGSRDGVPGDPTGITVINGKLVSEALNGRSSLIIPADKTDVRIASITSAHTAISSDGDVREVDGLNRRPKLIRSCGGVGGDTPTENIKHDFTCKDDSELVHFSPIFGKRTDAGEGVEAVLNEYGEVVELRKQRGVTIPKNGSVLSGTGEAAQWLELHAQVGMKLTVKNEVFADGEPLPLEQVSGIINGGPRLIDNGNNTIPAMAEGFHRVEDPEFYYRFGERRNPRTLTGVKADGTLLFVTVDGRAPGLSVGTNFKESALLMKSLGAVNALNLDGGGSTTMTIGNNVVNHPSDKAGERPIADAILFMP
ncbi:phosphodiester glycosidase family protein [Bacillus massilinigeriensis]|uniref:phosphodiester glycosidase family protein n=1 Tax=Bacillus mediterraneensis TaxID=1805474 RepID=UPI0009F4B9B0|nr:phosphodiester glycosidase family protein [Bacillus mediterraneensis]